LGATLCRLGYGFPAGDSLSEAAWLRVSVSRHLVCFDNRHKRLVALREHIPMQWCGQHRAPTHAFTSRTSCRICGRRGCKERRHLDSQIMQSTKKSCWWTCPPPQHLTNASHEPACKACSTSLAAVCAHAKKIPGYGPALDALPRPRNGPPHSPLAMAFFWRPSPCRPYSLGLPTRTRSVLSTSTLASMPHGRPLSGPVRLPEA
jgi:hypothetical protein